MKLRKVKGMVAGRQTVDGAGVKLVRVLNRDTVKEFDPFLMLDSFDSQNPEDYIKGFPMHPHRGIETITYLVRGEMEHQDSLGNAGTIHAGESQWMTAGSGILHQEMPQASEHMLGIQLWLNLPAHSKMAPPVYNGITAGNIPEVIFEGGILRIISGTYQGHKGGAVPQHVYVSIYDITLEPGCEITLPTETEDTVFIFTMTGGIFVDTEQYVEEKTAVLFESGDVLKVTAPQSEKSRFMFFSGKPLHEPIAWGGPIVMNTQEELRDAFTALSNNTFIQEV